jgi:hypothetical protein
MKKNWLRRLMIYFKRHPEPQPMPGMWRGELS